MATNNEYLKSIISQAYSLIELMGVEIIPIEVNDKLKAIDRGLDDLRSWGETDWRTK